MMGRGNIAIPCSAVGWFSGLNRIEHGAIRWRSQERHDGNRGSSPAKEIRVILEGIVTTVNADGSVHLAAMGAVVDECQARTIRRMDLRPYQGTATLANLDRSKEAVFHVTDDVELLARAALHRLDALPQLLPAPAIRGWILADACRWYALRVTSIDPSAPRALVRMEVVDEGRLRDFFGLNRAKHAVVEGAILATRAAWLPPEEIRDAFAQLTILVEKTGGESERRAFALVRDHAFATPPHGGSAPIPCSNPGRVP